MIEELRDDLERSSLELQPGFPGVRCNLTDRNCRQLAGLFRLTEKKLREMDSISLSDAFVADTVAACCRVPHVMTATPPASKDRYYVREELRVLRFHCRIPSDPLSSEDWSFTNFTSRIQILVSKLINQEIYPPFHKLNSQTLQTYARTGKLFSDLSIRTAQIEQFIESKSVASAALVASSGVMKLIKVAKAELHSMFSVTRAHVMEKYILIPGTANKWASDKWKWVSEFDVKISGNYIL